jgi:hypothetical protein
MLTPRRLLSALPAKAKPVALGLTPDPERLEYSLKNSPEFTLSRTALPAFEGPFTAHLSVAV